MTLQQFEALASHQQHKRLILQGVCIADRITESTQWLLFQLGDFYVEVAFSLDRDEIVASRVFEDVEELEPYLEMIDITQVI
jgi:hypothetical protein